MAQRKKFQLTDIRSLKQSESIRKDLLAGITDQATKNEMARRLESAAKRENTAKKNIKDVQRSMEDLNADWPGLAFDGKKISFSELTARLLEEISRDGAGVKAYDEALQLVKPGQTMRNFFEDFENMGILLSKLFSWRMKLWSAQREAYLTKCDGCRFQLDRIRNDPCFAEVLALGDVGGLAQIHKDQVKQSMATLEASGQSFAALAASFPKLAITDAGADEEDAGDEEVANAAE